MSQFLITINSIWILDFKIQKKYSMIAYKVFSPKISSQIELFEKIYFYKLFHLEKVFRIFLLAAAKHGLYADFHN